MGLRLNAEDVAYSPCLVSVLLVGLADSVDVVYADNPFVLCELDVAAEVVQVGDERGEDLSVAGLGLFAHQVDDARCEVGIEFAGVALSTIGAIGSV